ncbi:MAG: DUF333 domain-containing protein, partial [Halieaceae bacterium]|nr:DUF333 domain-containing protein [Halieaceae bacterium]
TGGQVGYCLFPDGSECEEWAFFREECAPGDQDNIGMPNPASVHCEDEGGKLEIRDEAGGQVGYCLFPDGSECEEWAYFRGECAPGTDDEAIGMPNPASVHCEDEGGKLEIRDEAGGQVGYCLFPDGSECEEWAFFREECAPAGDGQGDVSTNQVKTVDRNAGTANVSAQPRRRASTLPDVSGLAWIAGDSFLAVHDAKYPEEAALPRVSLLQLPRGLDGIRWRPLAMQVQGPKSNDFESIARIPETRRVLLVESTEEQDEKPFSRRIFLAQVSRPALRIVDTIEWPTATHNVEGTAVAPVGQGYLFIYAERAEGEGSTQIRYATLNLNPLQIGEFNDAGAFTSPGPTGDDARPLTAMEVDSNGVIYVASAEDPGDDNGPFRSAVYTIGQVSFEDGTATVMLDPEPSLLATLDGLKVESLAVRELPGVDRELYVGFDDENYGGTLRKIKRVGP